MPTQYEQMIANRKKTRKGYTQRPVAGGLREQWEDPTDPSSVNGIVSGRFTQTPRSPSVDAPATQDEIQRAFYGPTVFAPGGTPAQAAAAQQRLSMAPQMAMNPQSLLDVMRQRGGLQPATLGGPASLDAETIAGVQGIVGASPARQDRLAMAVRAPATKFVDGKGYVPLGRPAYGSGARNLQTSRVGAGTQSNGMTGGGAIGSSLMMSGAAVPGMAMGGVQQRQQPTLIPRPMTGSARDATGAAAPATEVSEAAFQQAWQDRPMTRSQTTPETEANRSEFATALAGRQGRVQERGLARGKAREERMQFSRDREQFGERGALVNAFQRQGVDPTRAMAMLQGNMQWLSEDNRQTRAATEFGEANRLAGQRESREQLQMRWTPRLAEAQAILNNPAATITEKNRAKQIMDEYDRSLTTAFGSGGGMSAAAPTDTGGGTSGGNVNLDLRPFDDTGVMVDPNAMPPLQTVAENYAMNPEQVGQQLMQMLSGPEFAHLSQEDKNKLMRKLTQRPNSSVTDPTGASTSGQAIGRRSIQQNRGAIGMTPQLVPW